jgi:hypothetical protein
MAFQFLEGWYSNFADVMAWYEHFAAKKIPAAIVSRPGYPRFTLWRGGKEVTSKKQSRSRTKWEKSYRIEQECHDFSKEVVHG